MGGHLDLEDFLGIDTDNEAELVVLVSSTEGGTGSGAVPLLAHYIKESYDINVHCFAFTGFEEDGRGLMNTVQYFQEMKESFTVECIQNSKYMDKFDGNRLKAERAANIDFCKKISILYGNPLVASDHNIDETDLFKVSTTPGYMIIEVKEFSKIKNREGFRQMVTAMIDETTTLDLNDNSQIRLAVMINIDEDLTGIIDYQDILIDKLGTCFEKFEHIQHEEDMPNFIAFISAGSKIPVKEIEAIYDKYLKYTTKVDKKKDSFFSKKFDMDKNDTMFDVSTPKPKKKRMDKSAFFAKLESDNDENNEVNITSPY